LVVFAATFLDEILISKVFTRKQVRWFGLILGLLLVAAPAFSQACALCYAQAASSGGRLIAALRSGILVLMLPPVVMSVGIVVMAYRKRNQFRADQDEEWTSRVL